MIKPWFRPVTAVALLSWTMGGRADDALRDNPKTIVRGASAERETPPYEPVRLPSGDRIGDVPRGSSDRLGEALEQSQREAPYRTPAPAELGQAERQFAEELAGHTGQWEGLGMRRLTIGSPPLVIVKESDDRSQGRGVFAFRREADRDWLLQAPHSRNDAHTGVLARQLFSEAPVRAAMWNTVSRNTEVVGGIGVADLAHLEASYWQALTRAFAVRYPSGRIIQLHGFEASKRKSRAASGLDMIVSAGREGAPPWVQTTAACLRRSLAPYRVGLYGEEVAELGATTNAQGRLLRNLGHAGFVHVEMSLPLREKLTRDETLRRRFLGCFGGHEL